MAKKSFHYYDCILHVAGIAHRKQTPFSKSLYFSVNRDLAISVAPKAKMQGVKNFIFISSFSVYGKNIGIIKNSTIPNPIPEDYYGQSKYQAEPKIALLQSDDFNVAIVHPPMVYGPNCKGNFPRLVSVAKKLPFFPDIENQRSMIFIDNLLEFFCIIAEKGCSGVFMPQDKEYVNTSSMVKEISINLGRRIIFTRIFNRVIFIVMPYLPSLQKAFGSLYYDESTKSNFFKEGWQVVDFTKAIQKTLSK